jgi:hypothetical protein
MQSIRIKYFFSTICLILIGIFQNDFALLAQPVITSQPTNQTNCTTLTASLCVTTSTGGTTYQWSYAAAQAGPYSNVASGTPVGSVYANGTTSCLSITMAAAGTYWFRCTLTSGGTTITNSVSLTVVAFTANCGTGIKTYGKSSANGNPDAAFSIVESTTSGITIVGESYGYDAGHAGDGVIFNIDGTNNGAFNWGYHLGSSSNGNPDYFRGMSKTSSGNYIVTGRVEKADFSQWELYVAEFPSSGAAPVWTQRLTSSVANITNDNRWGADVVQSTAGDYIVTGTTSEQWDFSGTGPQWANDMYVGRFNSGTGLCAWSKKIGVGANSGSADEESNALVENSDGTITIVGRTTTGVNDQIALVKLNSTGTATTWAKSIGNAGTNETGMSIIIASNGDYIVTGYTTAGAGGLDVWIADINSAGVIQWQKEVGTAAADEYGYSVIQTSDGNYVVAGQTENIVSGADDALFFKIKSDGTSILWSRIVDSGADNWSWDIVQMSDLTLASCGQRKWDPDDDMEFICLSSAGAISAACANSAPALTLTGTALANGPIAPFISSTDWKNGSEVTQSTTITTNFIAANCGTIILPVELTEFTAKCSSIGRKITWVTATEQNNRSFTIEHSKDAVKWEELGEVRGSGTTIASHTYSETYAGESSEYRYYRLKQTDFNGKENFSEFIASNCVPENNTVTNIYPNPTNNEINLDMSEQVSGNVHVQLTDVTGRVVFDESYFVTKESPAIKLYLSEIENGVYYLKTSNDEKGYSFTGKIMKK